jgi:ssDNA-binding Zn-finger/Zn-ribbon topoisomerase 1
MEEQTKMWKRLIEAHDCPESHGKIILISTDFFGNQYCGYCNKLVHYPRVSQEEFMEMIKNGLWNGIE